MRQSQPTIYSSSPLMAVVLLSLLFLLPDVDAFSFTPTTNTARIVTQQRQQQQRYVVKTRTAVRATPLSLPLFRDQNYHCKSTALNAHPGVAVAAITGAIGGGLFAGGLHAIAGPDHLAALLPRCCGQRWYKAGRVGALWGMGHGVSATIIGVLAFALKTTFRNSVKSHARFDKILAGASHLTEIAVGLSLVMIGIMGIREAREWREEIETVQPQSLSAAAVTDTGLKTVQKRAIIFNGLLHGFSWDGAPSLAPALAVATWGGNLAFLAAYAIGTVSTMAIATTLIGEGTRKAGQFFQRPDIPQKLSYFSSILAIAIGIVWCGLALI